MAVLAIQGAAHAAPLLNPIEEDLNLIQRIGNQLFQNTIGKVISKEGINFAVEILKDEAIAITSLFFCTLGILPIWISMAVSFLALVRLGNILYRATEQIKELNWAAQEAARLRIVNGDLRLVHDRALQARDLAQNEAHNLGNERAQLIIRKDELTAQLALAQGRIEELTLAQEQRAHQALHALQDREAIAPIAREHELIAGRDEIIRLRDEALRERDQIRHELQQVQLREIQMPQRLMQLEEERNALLVPIREAYNRAAADRREENITTLERAIETLLPNLQRGKEFCIEQLNGVIEQLAVDHPARRQLQDLVLIIRKEGQSLQIIGQLFAAPIHIRRNQNEV